MSIDSIDIEWFLSPDFLNHNLPISPKNSVQCIQEKFERQDKPAASKRSIRISCNSKPMMDCCHGRQANGCKGNGEICRNFSGNQKKKIILLQWRL